MQPYCFPYLGYFQLVASVDRFVFFDDVDFTRRGWINRNRILLDGHIHPFCIPVRHADMGTKIDRIHLAPEADYLKRRFLPTLRRAYGKASNFPDAYPIVEDIVLRAGGSLGVLARDSVFTLSRYLGLRTAFVPSSRLYGNAHLKGQTRILDTCRREGVRHYHNAPGGRSLYDPAAFAAHGIELRFVDPVLDPYRQHGAAAFVPGLSILDVVMNVGRREARDLVLCHAMAHPAEETPLATAPRRTKGP